MGVLPFVGLYLYVLINIFGAVAISVYSEEVNMDLFEGCKDLIRRAFQNHSIGKQLMSGCLMIFFLPALMLLFLVFIICCIFAVVATILQMIFQEDEN